MTIPAYARLAAKLLLREREQLPEPSAPAASIRADAVAALEHALVQRARRLRMRRTAYAGVAAAAILALAWLGHTALGTASSQNTLQASAKVTPWQSVVVHSFGAAARIAGANEKGELQQSVAHVQVPANGHALLAFKTGTRVTLEQDSDLTLDLDDAAQVLALQRGALRADVAKVSPGHRFLIHTPDAEVEVHGTSFRVVTNTDAVRCADNVQTRVEVFEGVVSVRHAGVEHRVVRGGVWPEVCTPAATPSAGVVPTAPSPVNVQAAQPAHPHEELAKSTPARSSGLPSSQLVEQNDAFAAAVAARHAGDLARAVRGFDALLARYPNGPLSESAEVQRINAMLELDRVRAQQLARDYLARYPGGFARKQAAEIADTSP